MSENKKQRITRLIKCKSCNGSGIYKGMAERDRIGVQCHTCKGSGKYRYVFEYEEFVEKERRVDVDIVLEANPGICAGINAEQGYTKTSFGGMSYKDWFAGKSFPEKSEMRNFTCPAWWYQTVDYKKKPEWSECWSTLGSTFSRCENFKHKDLCWIRFDQEQKDV